jgi:hypothetical protein
MLAASAAQSTGPVAVHFLGAPPQLKTFQTWTAGCDNTHVCYAVPGFEGLGVDGALSVERDAGPDGKLVVTLNDIEPGDPTHLDLTSIRIDGAPSAPAYGWKLDKEGDSATLEGRDAMLFLRKLANATSFKYRADGDEHSIPLNGLKAALLAMDDNQGRVGGETALARPGPKPATAVPVAALVPVIELGKSPAPLPNAKAFAAAVRKANGSKLKAAECDDQRSEGDAAVPLGGGQALVLIACSMNAHSDNTLLLRVSIAAPAKAEIVRLPNFPGRGVSYVEKVPTYPFADWDPKTATFSAASWSCAHACGENESWTFDGRQFVPSNRYVYSPSGGMTLYRTKVERR